MAGGAGVNTLGEGGSLALKKDRAGKRAAAVR